VSGERVCETCRYWHLHRLTNPASASGHGACRRWPPTLVWRADPERGEQPHGDWQQDFPSTAPTTWCGEWGPRSPQEVN